MRKTLLLILLFLGIQPVYSQTRKYAVKVVGIKVGEVIAKKQIKGDSVTYSLSSLVDVNFLIYKLKVDYRVNTVFEEDNFLTSAVKVESNRGNYFTETRRKGSKFKATSHQHDKTLERDISVGINSTFASLFFNEPKSSDKVYAEYYADFIEITKPQKEFYKGVLQNNIDEYYYENGELVKIVKKNPITDMVLEYQKPKDKITR